MIHSVNYIYIDEPTGLFIKKYSPDHWVNQLLDKKLNKYYSCSIHHCIEILQLLEPYDIVPKVIAKGKDYVILENCGISFYEIDKAEWYKNVEKNNVKSQVDNILGILKYLKIKHCDLHDGNILIDNNNKIRIIDFQLANYNGIVGITEVFGFNSLADIFCSRMTDDVLYSLVEPIDFEAMKIQIQERILNNIPKTSGKAGANVYENTLYCGLPFEFGVDIPAHRAFPKDRSEKIISTIPEEMKNGLDIGCSVGHMTFELAKNDKNMVGIDYDTQSIEFAEVVNGYKQFNIDFQNKEFNLDCAISLPQYDFIVWLDNFMWIAQAYGLDEAKKILMETSKKCELMYFETSQGGGMSSYQFTREEIMEMLFNNTNFNTIEDLGTPKDGWWDRNLFRLSHTAMTVLAILTTVIGGIYEIL